jgi:hypothetical protein
MKIKIQKFKEEKWVDCKSIAGDDKNTWQSAVKEVYELNSTTNQ